MSKTVLCDDEAPGADLEVTIDNGKHVKVNLSSKEWIIIGVFATIITAIVGSPLV